MGLSMQRKEPIAGHFQRAQEILHFRAGIEEVRAEKLEFYCIRATLRGSPDMFKREVQTAQVV